MNEAIEIKPPDVEPGFVQRIAPRLAVKAMGDRQRRRECRAMHIEHRAAPPKPGFLRWQEPQEQRQSIPRSGNAEMLLAAIEPRRGEEISHRTIHGKASSCGWVVQHSTHSSATCFHRTVRWRSKYRNRGDAQRRPSTASHALRRPY